MSLVLHAKNAKCEARNMTCEVRSDNLNILHKLKCKWKETWVGRVEVAVKVVMVMVVVVVVKR